MRKSCLIGVNADRPIFKDRFTIVGLILLLWGASMLVAGITAGGALAGQTAQVTPAAVKYPALVDVGSKQCIPCKMMEPVLEELNSEYAGVLRVEFIDVQVDPRRAAQLGVRGIPTQIFYDTAGKERYRHMGYISKDGILNMFKKLGINLAKKNPDKKK